MNRDDGEQPLCREQDISYLSPVTPLSGASNMRLLHSEASAHDRLGPFASAPCLTLMGTAGAGPCSRRGSHAIHLPISLPSERFCFPLFQRVTSQRYYEDSDSCSAHPPRRSPTYFATPSCCSVSNHGGCLAIASHHASVSSEFRTSP
jgi:hypothetical protein